MVNYKIVGKPLTHDEMLEIVRSGTNLYAIDTKNKEVVSVKTRAIKINLDTKQWGFMFYDEHLFEENELIFKTKRSAELYLKRKLRK